MEEDDRLLPKPVLLTPRLLDPLGVSELQDYIDALRAEIGRAVAEIARKSQHREAAAAVFRSPSSGAG